MSSDVEKRAYQNLLRCVAEGVKVNKLLDLPRETEKSRVHDVG
jgi:hypothetical protein